MTLKHSLLLELKENKSQMSSVLIHLLGKLEIKGFTGIFIFSVISICIGVNRSLYGVVQLSKTERVHYWEKKTKEKGTV